MALQILHEVFDTQETGSLQVPLTETGCVRCGGFLSDGRYIDLLDDSGQIEFEARRCVQCGDVVDPIILRNRALQRALSAQAVHAHSKLPQLARRVA